MNCRGTRSSSLRHGFCPCSTPGRWRRPGRPGRWQSSSFRMIQPPRAARATPGLLTVPAPCAEMVAQTGRATVQSCGPGGVSPVPSRLRRLEAKTTATRISRLGPTTGCWFAARDLLRHVSAQWSLFDAASSDQPSCTTADWAAQQAAPLACAARRRLAPMCPDAADVEPGVLRAGSVAHASPRTTTAGPGADGLADLTQWGYSCA